MANIKSQIKRIGTNRTATERNRAYKSELRTAIRRVRSAVSEGNKEQAELALTFAAKKLDKAVSKGVMVAGTFPASSHDPVTYPFAVTRAGDSPEARALLAFLAGPQAQKVFAKYGFDVLKK